MTGVATLGTLLHGSKVTISGNDIMVDSVKINLGTKLIIDNVLIWSGSILVILIYFDCMCMVFQKYRVSFRLDKCRFLESRVEFVGHDLTSTGNCPAKAKFDLSNDWVLPPTGQSLRSFVGLMMFYLRCDPYLKIIIKPFSKLIKI